MIAFTMGSAASYDDALTRPPVTKVGKSGDYPGGAVFRTAEEVQAFLDGPVWPTIDWGDGGPRDPRGFKVYRLNLPASWEEMTYQLPGESFRRLLLDAVIEGPVQTQTHLASS